MFFFFNWLLPLFSAIVIVMDHKVSAATGINVSLSSPNSSSLVPGLTTTTNTAMAPSATIAMLIPLSNTQ